MSHTVRVLNKHELSVLGIPEHIIEMLIFFPPMSYLHSTYSQNLSCSYVSLQAYK